MTILVCGATSYFSGMQIRNLEFESISWTKPLSSFLVCENKADNSFKLVLTVTVIPQKF